MAKELWINLPVKDVGKSREFFNKIGFLSNLEHGASDEMACVQLGEKKFNVLLLRKTNLEVLQKMI